VILEVQSLECIPPPADTPDPDEVRGKCPMCGDPVVSRCFYVTGKGYICLWLCWSSLRKRGCDYRRVL